MNRNIDGEAIDAIHDLEDARDFGTVTFYDRALVDILTARKLLVGEINGADTLAIEQIRKRHKARLAAEKDGVIGGVREDFEVVRLLGIIDKLMRNR